MEESSFTPMYTSDIHLVDYPKYNGQIDADVVLLGIPFDQAVCNRPGARFAPRAIRLASSMHFNRVPYGWEELAKGMTNKIYDLGDINLDYARPHMIKQQIKNFLQPWMSKSIKTLTLGGDHSISFPLIQNFSEKLQRPISLIQFDSHSDTWADVNEDRIDHGSMFYHAVKKGYIDPQSSIQLGIRSYNEDPLGIFTLDNAALHSLPIEQAAAKVREKVGDNPCYISFDIDFFDPAFAPGTGTPVCGGFSTYYALALLKHLQGLRLMGADIVELNPAYDHADISALAAATLMQAFSVLLCLAPKTS